MKIIWISVMSLFILSTGFAKDLNNEEIALEVVKDAQAALGPFKDVALVNTIGAICFRAAWADGSLGNMLFIHNKYNSISFFSENPTYLQIRQDILKRVIQNKNVCESEDVGSISVVKANSEAIADLLKTLIQSL